MVVKMRVIPNSVHLAKTCQETLETIRTFHPPQFTFPSIRIVVGGGRFGGGVSVHAGLKHAASTSSPPVSPPSTLQYRKKFRRMSREGSSSGEKGV